MKHESNMSTDGADNDQQIGEHLTPPSPQCGEGEADRNAMPPMRSQSELNLPAVEPWPEPVDGRDLLNELRQLANRLVVLPKWAGETVAFPAEGVDGGGISMLGVRVG